MNFIAQEFIYDETSFVFAPHIPRREMVPLRQVNNCQKQCESDLDEIFSLNSILFGYKLCFYDKSFQEKYSVIFSQYMKSIQVLI